jgi:predicted nucleic acid-binding protein
VKFAIDSYAWIEHFSGTEKGRKIKELMDNSDEVYTPDVVLAEIARKYLREGQKEATINSRLDVITSASTIIAIDSQLAFEAATAYLELKKNAKKHQLNTPGPFDAIILATCRLLKAKIVTGDEHFKDLPETIWIK